MYPRLTRTYYVAEDYFEVSILLPPLPLGEKYTTTPIYGVLEVKPRNS